MSSSDLLSTLANDMHKKYLSDLHRCSVHELMVALDTLAIDAYSLSQWEYALSYILNVPVSLSSIDEVKPFVKKLASSTVK